ncbi:MAG: hypothetical protein HQK83_14720 [Fibrobacteria bacterium]|nr:hypothetical protein [Fibrobacteria bacterium]
MTPKILGLFQLHIAGDNSLFDLAARYFDSCGMGYEIHAYNLEELEAQLQFTPSQELPVVLHLPRDLSVKDARLCSLIKELRQCKRDIYGFVLHDESMLTQHPKQYEQAVRKLAKAALNGIHPPYLFIEYAVMHEFDDFHRFFMNIKDLPQVNVCLDIGHIGMKIFGEIYKKKGEYIWPFSATLDDPLLPGAMDSIQTSLRNITNQLCAFISQFSQTEKPVHFHLHDGHPLSRFSPYGVKDHLGFTQSIPLPFEYKGHNTVETMYGPKGLAQILSAAMKAITPDKLSLTLEIHPTGHKKPLGDFVELFRHWTQKDNAEKMNYWLYSLEQNFRLVSQHIHS